MTPAASVSGLYFAHPQAKYFVIQRVGADQVEDYARRKGIATSPRSSARCGRFSPTNRRRPARCADARRSGSTGDIRRHRSPIDVWYSRALVPVMKTCSGSRSCSRRCAARSSCALGSAQQPQPPAQTPQQPFEPTVGQAGKDVVWVPTPPELVEKMLDMAEVTPQRRRDGPRIGRRPQHHRRRQARRARHRRRVQPRHGRAVAADGARGGRWRQGHLHRRRHVRGRHLGGHGAGAVPAARQSRQAEGQVPAPPPRHAHRPQHVRHPRLGA